MTMLTILQGDALVEPIKSTGNNGIVFSRYWGMPSADTFDCEPIKGFVQKYLLKSKVSIDPFARNKRWATYTNDLNPNTAAQYHLDAEAFLTMLSDKGVVVDLVIFDPPYSLRQVKECYEGVGRDFLAGDSQNSIRWTKERDLLVQIVSVGGIVLSFGWNSAGMGMGRNFTTDEILLVTHGPAHNDTICMAEHRRHITPGLTLA